MKYFIFDTETTGTGKFDEVVELGGIWLDEQFKICDVFHKYWLPLKLFDPKAASVNGLSMKLLSEKTSRFIEQDIYKISQDNVCYIEWSSLGFDKKMINQTLSLHGYDQIDFGRDTKSIKALRRQHIIVQDIITNGVCGGQPGRLRDIAERVLSLDERQMVNSLERKLFNTDGSYHSASYDALITAIIVVKYKDYLL